MLQTLKRLLLSVSLAGLFALPMLSFVPVAAQCTSSGTPDIQGCVSTGTCLNTNTSSCDTQGTPEDRVNAIIRLVINIFSLVVGVVAVIMIIIGGFKYITSGGDSGNVSSAKNTIMYALIGLIIVALAQIIVRFVLQKVTTS